MSSSELYRKLVESSAEGLWVLDDAGRTVFTNARLAEMLGMRREDMDGRDHADFLDEDGRAQWREHIARLEVDGAVPLPVDCRFVRADGVPVWFLVTEARLHDDDGTPAGILLSLSEFDARRRLETELDENGRKLLDAQRIARMGSWSWEAEADELTISSTVHDIVEIDRAVLPMTLEEALGTFDDAERARLEDATRSLLEGQAGTTTFDVAATGVDGPIWLRVRAVANRAPDGSVRGLSGTVQDVTEARLAEDSLRDLAHQNLLMQRIAVAANQSRTLVDALITTGELVVEHDDWARARAFWLSADGAGRLEAGPAAGRTDEELTDPALPARELATAESAVARRTTVWDADVRLTLACPVMLGEEPVAVVVITSDPPLYRHEIITSMVAQVAVQLSTVAEREATARELATARDAAMEASRQKSEFLATMSHEIRTPLNGVIGLNDLLRATDLDPHQQRLTSGVGVSGRALLGIVDDILDFSKIEAGLLELEEIDLDLRQVLDDVAAMTVETAGARTVELVVHCDRDVPDLVRGDRVRLTQLVSNLVSNAMKFTEEGEVVVRARLDPAPDGADRLLRVEVRDTGVGIPPDRVQGIFDPFIQADASTTRKYGGTGLGLAIVREIVAALGGEVGVTSEPGVGSTFWFTTPLTVAAAPRQQPPPGLQGRSALVIDPHPSRRAADVETLAHWDMQATGVDPAEVTGSLHRAGPSGPGVDVVLLSSDEPGIPVTSRELGDVPVVRLHGPDQATTADPGERGLERPVAAARLRQAVEAALVGADLPASTSHARDRPHDPNGEESVAPAGRGRVLVVEDTPLNQLVAEGLLAALGYESESVEDGVRALGRLAEDDADFDLVLMDVQMPRLDGYATSRAIRERERAVGSARLPIVAMTATAVTGERERCLEAGMDDFLTKPVSPARLATVLGDHVATAVGDRQAPPAAGGDGAADEGGRGIPGELLPHLDLARLDMLRDLDPGNTSYLDRVIGNFVTRSPGLAGAVGDAVAAEDPVAVTASAHRLRGSALNLGVPQAADAAMALELLGESGKLYGAAEILERLELALDRGREAVLAYRASYHPSPPA